MSRFVNLGALIDHDRDLGKIAVIDLGGEGAPREFSYAALDDMANDVARALQKRGLARGTTDVSDRLGGSSHAPRVTRASNSS